MRVLIISTNKIQAPRPALPIGMAIIAGRLSDAGHDVDSLDLLFETHEHRAVIETIRRTNPDVIAISVRNLDNLTFLDPIYFAPLVRRIIMCCRKYSEAEIILGGSGFSVAAKEMMHYARPDFGIIGEGEQAIVDLIERRLPPEEIPGVYFWCGNEPMFHPPQLMPVLKKDSTPDRRFYDQRYFKTRIAAASDLSREFQLPFETVQSKRGCNLACSYCIIRQTEGGCARIRSPEEVADEIIRLGSYEHVEEVEFVDASFNHPKEHAIAVCEALIARGNTTPWFCQIGLNGIDAEFIRLMERAGCKRVELGTDALSDPVLDKLQKGYDMSHVGHVDSLFTNSTIEHTHCVFLGGPDETPQGLQESLNTATNILQPAQVYAVLGIRILGETSLQKLAWERGILPKNHPMLVPTYYIEPEVLMDNKALDKLRTYILNNKHWYLWWGLSRCSIQERVPQIQEFQNEWIDDWHDATRKISVAS